MITYFLVAGIFFSNAGGGCQQGKMDAWVKAVPIIAIGRMEKVEVGSGVASGHLVNTQQVVSYYVKDVLKGKIGKSYIDVSHPIVAGSRTVKHTTNGFFLDPSTFSKGNELVLLLFQEKESESSSTDTKYVAADENCAPLASAELVKFIKKRLTYERT